MHHLLWPLSLVSLSLAHPVLAARSVRGGSPDRRETGTGATHGAGPPRAHGQRQCRPGA